MTVTPEQLFQTMVSRQRVARTEQLKNAEVLKERVRQAVAAAMREGLIQKTWLIGSLAWGEHGEGSDVDLVVLGVAPTDIDALWARLAVSIGGELDLLRFEELPDAFRKRVLDQGLVLS